MMRIDYLVDCWVADDSSGVDDVTGGDAGEIVVVDGVAG